MMKFPIINRFFPSFKWKVAAVIIGGVIVGGIVYVHAPGAYLSWR